MTCLVKDEIMHIGGSNFPFLSHNPLRVSTVLLTPLPSLLSSIANRGREWRWWSVPLSIVVISVFALLWSSGDMSLDVKTTLVPWGRRWSAVKMKDGITFPFFGQGPSCIFRGPSCSFSFLWGPLCKLVLAAWIMAVSRPFWYFPVQKRKKAYWSDEVIYWNESIYYSYRFPKLGLCFLQGSKFLETAMCILYAYVDNKGGHGYICTRFGKSFLECWKFMKKMCAHTFCRFYMCVEIFVEKRPFTWSL